MRIGYAKLGRSMPLSPAKWGKVGGDNEPPILLQRLARAMPEHEFIIIGRNSGDVPADVGFPSNVTNPWTEWRGQVLTGQAGSDYRASIQRLDEITMPMWAELDAVITWAGQHGPVASPIPKIGGGSLTTPQASFVNYCSYIVRGISLWRDADPHNRKEIWLCPDPRNYLKARDLKWPPPPILAQYNWKKKEKHYRYEDPTEPEFFGCAWAEPGVWHATHEYIYSQLEVMGVPRTTPFNDDPTGRGRFGSIMNETATNVRRARIEVMRDWVLPQQPDFVHGTWSDKSQQMLGQTIEPIPWDQVFPTLQRVKCTITAPAVGTGWATAKPWETFASGTVCFFHPMYDDQNNVLSRPGFEELHAWLRIKTPGELQQRVQQIDGDDALFRWIVQEQRRLFEQALDEAMCITMIRERL